MGIHGEWQTCNDSLTIREFHSTNGNANDHRCYIFEKQEQLSKRIVFAKFDR